jgi:hypothetical protein
VKSGLVKFSFMVSYDRLSDTLFDGEQARQKNLLTSRNNSHLEALAALDGFTEVLPAKKLARCF